MEELTALDKKALEKEMIKEYDYSKGCIALAGCFIIILASLFLGGIFWIIVSLIKMI